MIESLDPSRLFSYLLPLCADSSSSKLSATTKDDLLDLLDLTAPVASGPSKGGHVDTDTLLHGISLPDSEFCLNCLRCGSVSG